MIIFKDVISGDEVISDAFPMVQIDDIVYEVKTKNIIKSSDEDFVPNNDEEGGPLPSDAVTVNNVVDAHNLQPTQFNKKAYVTYIKGYMKALETHLQKSNPGRVPAFKKAAQDFVAKKLLQMFDEFQFFTGESMNPEGTVVLMFYKSGDTDPHIWVFKDGLSEEKV